MLLSSFASLNFLIFLSLFQQNEYFAMNTKLNFLLNFSCFWDGAVKSSRVWFLLIKGIKCWSYFISLLWMMNLFLFDFLNWNWIKDKRIFWIFQLIISKLVLIQKRLQNHTTNQQKSHHCKSHFTKSHLVWYQIQFPKPILRLIMKSNFFFRLQLFSGSFH